jgi:hypothetical protein
MLAAQAVPGAQTPPAPETDMKTLSLALLLMFLSSPAGAAAAAGSAAAPDLAALDARIQALEAQAQQLRVQAAAALDEARAARAELEQMKAAQAQNAVVVAPAPVAAPAPEPTSSANGNAFNPAISVVLDGVYAHHSLDPDDYVLAGFPLVGEAGPGEQGLSLGESELTLSANVDDKFYGQLTLAYDQEEGDTGISLEEAYIDTLALPAGFTLRAGRFFSNIGYLNSHHTHTDLFSDRPLVYQAFLANQYDDDGVQLRWVAPTDLYLELGGELFRGDAFPAGGAANSGVGAGTVFAHLGGDLGIENSWLAGFSLLDYEADIAEDGFDGDGMLYITDLTWKWARNGNSKDGGITARAEYFHDDRDGSYVDADDPAQDQPWIGSRSGLYVEGVWRINRRWDTGYRYDKLWADDSGPYASSYDPDSNSVMLTWRNSEFSLVRLQLSRAEPQPRIYDNAISLQYQVNLGAHGAHKY